MTLRDALLSYAMLVIVDIVHGVLKIAGLMHIIMVCCVMTYALLEEDNVMMCSVILFTILKHFEKEHLRNAEKQKKYLSHNRIILYFVM